MALNETNHALEFLLSEDPGMRSREAGTLNSGESCVAGEVLGQIKTAVGAKVSGTGDGVVGAVTLGSAAEVGVYVLTGKTEASGGGTFSVRTPSGGYLPDLTVAVAYASSHINLTVADGSADWDIGDVIHVTVTGGDYAPFDPAATDGSQTADAILFANSDATDADQGITVLARDAEVSADMLTWPDAVTDANKSIATARLAARGIILR